MNCFLADSGVALLAFAISAANPEEGDGEDLIAPETDAGEARTGEAELISSNKRKHKQRESINIRKS